MGSKALETKENQKARFAAEAEGRLSMLKEKGLDDKQIARDSILKRLKARMKQVDGAIKRIAFLDDQKTKLAERKQQRLAEEAAARIEERSGSKKAKGKAKVEEPKPAAGGKKAKGQAKAQGGDKKDAKKKGK